jgi:hypothetical protein
MEDCGPPQYGAWSVGEEGDLRPLSNKAASPQKHIDKQTQSIMSNSTKKTLSINEHFNNHKATTLTCHGEL